MSEGFDYTSWGPQSSGVLSAGRKRAKLPQVEARAGLVLEDVTSGWVGAVTRTEKSGGMHVLVLENRLGRTRSFPLGFGFLLDGSPVEVVAPVARPAGPAPARRTASGSVMVTGERARVARASRIWVEGKHDAELVEKVWGDDLRVEGIVVEPLGGIDDLVDAVRDFQPGPQRRLGVLVDHLVPNSKESRIAAEALAVPGARDNLLIVGHPYVDVWQAIKPSALGIAAWPTVPRSVEWKMGIMQAFGWPAHDHQDIARGWQRLLSAVRSYSDLEPSLLGRVEEVIDFLTVP
nr:DUF3097 domain-containing protein [Psychromicrobium sp. YIM S02556]